ncbi:MAG: hypothetical protein MK179_17785 [Pirellulaceae bacterium]|nr:hypothetical protein [Pirellulaceae bacterium]
MIGDRRRWWIVCFVSLVGIRWCAPADAVDWLGTIDQSWHVDANWDSGTAPGSSDPNSGDDAEINTISPDYFPVVSVPGAVARDVLLGTTAPGQMTVNSGGTLSARSLQVGLTGSLSGALLVTGGNVLLDEQLQLGVAESAFGIVTLSGGTVQIGNMQTGDVADRDDILVGATAANTGDNILVVDGVWLQGRDLIVSNGASGHNELEVNSGTVDAKSLLLAQGDSTFAYATLSGGDLQLADDVIIADGVGSDGNLDIIDGLLSARSLTAALSSDSFATMTMVGGTLDTAGGGDVVIGHAGDAALLLSGGNVLAQNVAVALVDGTGLLTFTDGSLTTSADFSIAMDQFALGFVDQTGGTATVGGNLLLTGNSSAAMASYTLAGGTLDLTGGTVQFNAGMAEFFFTGGRLEHVASYGATLYQEGGTIAPGGSVGAMSIQGDYYVTGGSYEAEVDGTAGTADIIYVQGTATLSGELVVQALLPYPETGFYSQHILTASQISGAFVDDPITTGGEHAGFGTFVTNVEYSPTDVTVQLFQALSGDTNGDQDVDISDFNGLAIGFDPMGVDSATNDWQNGDFDSDGDIDISDFNALTVNFSPTGYGMIATVVKDSGTVRSVPEPQAVITLGNGLLLITAVLGVVRRCPPSNPA